MMDLDRRAAWGVRWTGASALLTTAMQLLQLWALARCLTAAEFGQAALAMLIFGLAHLLLDAAVNGAVVRGPAFTDSSFASFFWWNLGLGSFLCALAWFTLPYFPGLSADFESLSILRWSSLSFIGFAACKPFEAILQRELEFQGLARILVAATAGGAAAAIALAWLGFGAWSLVLGQFLLLAIHGVLLAARCRTFVRLQLHFRMQDLKGYLGIGFYQLGERSLNFLSARLDQVFIGALAGLEALGVYNFAFTLASQPLNRIQPIFLKVALPVFARFHQDASRLRSLYLRLLEVLMAVNAPLLLGLAACASTAVPLLFGPQWTAGVPVLQVLCLAILLRCIGNPLSSLILVRGRADLSFRWNLLLVLLTIPTVLGGAAAGRLIGVAWSLTALQLAIKIPGYFLMLRPLIGPCGRAYAWAILKPALMASAMALVVRVQELLELPPALRLTLQLLSGAAAYSFLLWIFSRDLLARLLRFEIAADNPPASSGAVQQGAAARGLQERLPV